MVGYLCYHVETINPSIHPGAAGALCPADFDARGLALVANQGEHQVGEPVVRQKDGVLDGKWMEHGWDFDGNFDGKWEMDGGI